MKYLVMLLAFVGLHQGAAHLRAEERPNILWITAEDMSPTLGCYGDDYATSPNIDCLAQQSTRYRLAFATAPVCSPSRSCLITGCYATSLGTHQMRSAFPVPRFIRGFPSLLRDAGYYTSNNSKTDYNTSSADRIIAESWDESSESAHWRNRPRVDGKPQPFFSIFNIMTSHQSRSMVWTQDRFRNEVQSRLSQADVHDPDNAPLPPYYPDSLVTRRIVARYYDCVTAMDDQVGAILAQLKEDGLDENTIVFFYSDHGSGMPRHKRLLHDSGMHVPLLIRFPKKWAHLAPTQPGETTDRLVSFVDFAPTVLKLAGIQTPAYMQGVPFLGHDAPTVERKYVFGHRDRIDEVVDCARSVRDGRYLYIRNFMPYLSWNQYSAYSDLSEIRHEFYRLAESGDGSAAQMHYAGPTKPFEELYDCVADPDNVHNLADSKQHSAQLRALRSVLEKHIEDTLDFGFVPEVDAWHHVGNSTPWEVARSTNYCEHVLAITAARWAKSWNEADARSALLSKSSSIRYWGAMGLSGRFRPDEATRERLVVALQDPAPIMRIQAAYLLCRWGDVEQGLPILRQQLTAKDLTTVLYAARAIELLGNVARDAVPAMRQLAERSAKLTAADTPAVFRQSGEQDLAMFCSFAANGFLQRLAEGPWHALLSVNQRKAWTNVNQSVRFLPESSQVTLLSEGENLWIVHQQEFRDFELTAEVKMPGEEYNAGIGFRCQMQPNGRMKGYQCEVAEEKTGMLYAIASGGWVWPRGESQEQAFYRQVGDAFRSNCWNHIRIRCDDSQVRIWVNGILSTDITDDRHRSGHIALQHHGKGGPHQYRNVRIRELN